MPSHEPIRAIVSRFSFPFSKETMERVLTKHPFAHCAIIGTGKEPDYFSAIPQESQAWFISSEVRGCNYGDVDWNTLQPIDASLIEALRECESMFMGIVARQEWKYDVPYATRKRWYLRQLQFWNDYIDRHHINLFVSAWLPHEIPDIVIYYLCKHKGIPVVYFHMSTERDAQFSEHDIVESAVQIRKRFDELKQEYVQCTEPEQIPLSASVEERYQALTSPAGQKPVLQTVKLPTYWTDIAAMILQKPIHFIRCFFLFFTPSGLRRIVHAMHRSYLIRTRNAYYDKHAIEPVSGQRFVYLALHFQPEASTMPMAGAYADQILLARMLNALLPDDVHIYVKEHYRESSFRSRSIEYYQDFLELNKVRLISRHVDTFTLREHCSAVATATGSVGFEALFRGKPVFMFGSRFYQYAEGVYRIHSVQDLQNALEDVFVQHVQPSLVDARLYLKAMDETCVHGTLNPWDKRASKLSDEDHISACSNALIDQISSLR